MKTIKIISLLLLVSAVLFAQDRNYTRTVKVSKGATLEVSLNPGDIVVKTGKDDEVIITAKGLPSDEFDNVEVEERGNSIYVDFDSGWGWSGELKFTFTVPSSLHLNLSTSGGDIDIKDELVGEVSVKTSGGDISVGTVQGRLSANTSGGDIAVDKSAGDMTLNTSGGDIAVGEILGKTANVKTMGGDITIKFSEASLNARTMGGDINIGDVGGNAKATTMGGDIELQNVSGSVMMETYGGDLTLMSATGKVEADTKGGDIDLRNVKGSLSAKTAGGDIYAELYPNGGESTYLKSSGGDIELKLPSSAKVSIDAEVRIRGSWRNHDECVIKSDFTDQLWKSGKDKKDLEAKFDINGGGQKIRIETINSNIYINEM